MIKVTYAYLDIMINSPIIQTISKRPFTARTSCLLARVFDKLHREVKIYLAERQRLIEKYAKRHEKDGGGNGKKGIWFQTGNQYL